MKTLVAAISCTALLALTAAAARADFCMQLNGGPFSGDLGFFRFKGSAPKAKGAIKTLAGRVAGLSPVFGTATVARDGTFLEIAATFFADATEGQFDVSFFPATSKDGDGNGDYGAYGVGVGVTAKIVSCTLEP